MELREISRRVVRQPARHRVTSRMTAHVLSAREPERVRLVPPTPVAVWFRGAGSVGICLRNIGQRFVASLAQAVQRQLFHVDHRSFEQSSEAIVLPAAFLGGAKQRVGMLANRRARRGDMSRGVRALHRTLGTVRALLANRHTVGNSELARGANGVPPWPFDAPTPVRVTRRMQIAM